MKRVFESLLCMLVIQTCTYAAPFLNPFLKKYGDPSMHQMKKLWYTDAIQDYYIMDKGWTSFTLCEWVKSDVRMPCEYSNPTLAARMTSASDFFVVSDGPTLFPEGLDNVMTTDYLTSETLPLDSTGVWVDEQCIPDGLTNGVFNINIRQRSSLKNPITLEFGGGTYTIPVYTNDIFVVNIPSSQVSGKAVKIIAEPGAKISFGFGYAANAEFHGVDWAPVDSKFGLQPGGFVTNEYRFVIRTAELIEGGTKMRLSINGYVPRGKLIISNSTEVAMSHAMPDGFPVGTQVRTIPWFVAAGAKGAAMEGDMSTPQIFYRSFGRRVYQGLLSEDIINRMVGLDFGSMVKQGLTYNHENGQYWAIEAMVNRLVLQETPLEGLVCNETSLKCKCVRQEFDNGSSVGVKVIDCISGDNAIKNSDIEWRSTGDYTFEGDEFTYSTPGEYTISGYNEKFGETKEVSVDTTASVVKTNVTWYTDADIEASTVFGRTMAVMSLPYIMSKPAFNEEAVLPKTTSFTAWGKENQYYYDKVARMACRPVSSSAGSQGNKAYTVVSPHYYVSATHYSGNYAASTLEYTGYNDKGEVITSTVTTDGNLISLSNWAKTNDVYAFSSEEIQGVSDVSIGKFVSGTVDSSLCPYFMTTNTFAECFSTNKNVGILAWCATQHSMGYGIPCLLNTYSGTQVSSRQQGSGIPWATSFLLGSSTRAIPHTKSYVDGSGDLINLRGNLASSSIQVFPQAYSGDSGMPVVLWIMKPGVSYDFQDDASWFQKKYEVLISLHHTASYSKDGYTSGDLIPAGYNVIKAFLESHGDSIKTFEK